MFRLPYLAVPEQVLLVSATHSRCRPGRRRGSRTRGSRAGTYLATRVFAARWIPARAPRELTPAGRLAGMTIVLCTASPAISKSVPV